MREKQIALIGTVGVPANYGGFETLAENLVKFHWEKGTLPFLVDEERQW